MKENRLPMRYTAAKKTGRNNNAQDRKLSDRAKLEDAPDSKVGTWLLTSGIISVTTLFVALYTIRYPEGMPNLVAQTVKISKQLSTAIKGRASTQLGGTAVTDTAGIHGASTGRNSAGAIQSKGETNISGVTRNSVVSGTAPASLGELDGSAAQHYSSSSGAGGTLASGRDETGTPENARHARNGNNHAARSDDSGSGGMLPALSAQSKPITNNPMDSMNQGFSQGGTSPVTEMPKAAEAKTSKSKKGFLVPPPPPIPYVLPPAFSLFSEQQLQQAQAQASPKAHNQAAVRENTPQHTTADPEANQSAAVGDAEQELQAAVRRSLHTMGEWTR